MCNPGFYFDSPTTTCIQTSLDPSCSNVNSQDTACKCMNAGTALTFNQQMCVTAPSTAQNCVILSPDMTGCSVCTSGYILTISNDVKTWTCVLMPTGAIASRLNGCWAAYPSLNPTNPGAITHCRFCMLPFTGPPPVVAGGPDQYGNTWIQKWDSYLNLGQDYQCYDRKTLGAGCPVWAIKSDLECAYCGMGYYITPDKKCLPLPVELDRWCETFAPASSTDPTNICATC